MPIQLELGESNRRPRIVLKGSAPRDAGRIKSIPGARVKNTGRGTEKTFEYWHFPLDLTTAHMIRQAFPSLQMSEDLWDWAAKEKRRRKAIQALHYGGIRHETRQLKRVPKLAPEIWKAMQNRGYQTVVPEFARKVGSHFNADQPGLGKTIEELGALVECGVTGKILIIAPRKALRATWGPEIRRWLYKSKFKIRIVYADSVEGAGDDREDMIRQFIQRPDRPGEMNFLLINPEMTRYDFWCPGSDGKGKDACRSKNSRTCEHRKQHDKVPYHPSLFRIAWKGVLLDETHKFMLHANERSASVSRVGFGLQNLTADYKVGMSGTPFKGKPRLFWMILHWLRPDLYTAQGRWQEAYFETVDNFYSQSKKAITENMRNDREWLYNQELDMMMIRRTKRELHAVNPNWAPPDKQYVMVELEMDPRQRKAYEAMRDDAIVHLKSGMLMANGRLAEMTRLKQLASGYGRMEKVVAQKKINGELRTVNTQTFHPALPSCKWDWIQKVFLAERGILDGDGDIKVSIASQYVQLLELYAKQLEKLKIPYFFIHGGTKDTEYIQRIWQRKYHQGDPRVLLLGAQAGGVSLTLDAADDVVINDENGVPDDTEQVEDRFHRTSRTDHQVTVYRLVTIGTVDETITRDSDGRDDSQKRLLDGRRGVSYLKEVLSV